MTAAKTGRPPVRNLLTLARWVAVGTASSSAFGFVLGLPFCLPFGSWFVPIVGLIFGLCGGPFFGLAIGWLDRVGREGGRGSSWRVGAFSLAGAVVFGLLPVGIGLARGQSCEIPPGEIGEALFGLGVMAAAGASLGAMVGSMLPERDGSKAGPDRNGWSELEL